jgi:hypothetical protein
MVMRWNLLVSCILASCASAVPGCATLPRGPIQESAAPDFAYAAGRATQSFAAPPSAVLAALNDAMGDLNLVSIRPTREGTVSRIEADTADRRKVAANVRSNRGTSQVAVRVGWFGDEALSRALLERVGVRLGTRDPQAIPASAPSSPAPNPYFARDAVPDSVMLRDFAEAPYRDRVIP